MSSNLFMLREKLICGDGVTLHVIKLCSIARTIFDNHINGLGLMNHRYGTSFSIAISAAWVSTMGIIMLR